MRTTRFLLVEFFILFIVLPVSFAFSYPILIKGILALLGFVYILVVLFRFEKLPFMPKEALDWQRFWKRVATIFLIVVVVTAIFVYISDPDKLFFVPRNNLGLYVIILFIYTFLSVWPQEVIYRTFFFQRYERLVQNRFLFIFLNGILFSLAHIFFRNTLVLILTFTGGILFAITYRRFRSTVLVSIEHAIYGNWLFTVGMGQMLAFPGMDGV